MKASKIRFGTAVAAIALGAAVALSGCGGINRGVDAALLLGDIRAGKEDSRLKRRTESPERFPVTYTIDSRDWQADRYRSGEPDRGPLVLVHGFTELGRRDPRLVEFAHSMARSGFDVLVPELPGLTELSVGTEEIDGIADALREATADGRSTGVAAISFAAGPALLAAKKDDLVDRVAYVVVVGGYYDLIDAIRYATTGHDAGSGRLDPVPAPRREGKWVVLLGQLHNLEQMSDREALREIAERRLEDEQAPIHDQEEELSAEGQAVLDLITNQDPERVELIVDGLPASVREELEALDLARRDLSPLQARVVLIHGPDDRVIPVSHSERLKAALPERQARLYRARGLDHVDVSPGIRGGWQLWRAAKTLLRIAEEDAGTRPDNRERTGN